MRPMFGYFEDTILKCILRYVFLYNATRRERIPIQIIIILQFLIFQRAPSRDVLSARIGTMFVMTAPHNLNPPQMATSALVREGHLPLLVILW